MTRGKFKLLSLTGLIVVSLSTHSGLAGSETSLTQALSERASSDGFELSGIDQVGSETTNVSGADHSVTALRKLLTGYSYILELDPNNHSATAERKPVRLRILGRAGDNTVDPSAMPQLATASNAGESAEVMSNARPSSGEQTHPIARLLQSAAAGTMPQIGAASGQTLAGSGGISQGVGSQSANTSSGDPAHSAAVMATLTQAASANVSALVAGLKAACPAGSKC